MRYIGPLRNEFLSTDFSVNFAHQSTLYSDEASALTALLICNVDVTSF